MANSKSNTGSHAGYRREDGPNSQSWDLPRLSDFVKNALRALVLQRKKSRRPPMKNSKLNTKISVSTILEASSLRLTSQRPLRTTNAQTATSIESGAKFSFFYKSLSLWHLWEEYFCQIAG